MDSTRVTAVKWVPGSEHQFVSSHRSGNLYMWTTESHATSKVYGPPNYILHKEPLDAKIYAVKQKHKSPLLFRWSIGHGSINSFAFSPDSIHIAIVSQDGFLRVYNFKEQTLYGRMRSYFGGLLCVCWSPDGKYTVTGGEDDLVTVWTFKHKRVVARGDGHKSYVTAVAFDPYMTILPSSPNSPTSTCGESPTSAQTQQAEVSSAIMSPEDEPSVIDVVATNTDSTNTESAIASATASRMTTGGHVLDNSTTSSGYTAYRLGSIGQDTQLCLWDLSGDALNIRRLNRARSRVTRQHSSRPVSIADSGLEMSPSAMESSELGRSKDTEEKSSSLNKEVEEESLVKGPSPLHNHVGSDHSTEGKLAPNSLLEANHHKDSVSISSISSSVSAKSKKKDKDKKKSMKSHRRTLKEPMRKVIKFVGSGFSTSNQNSGHHGRGQMGNFETCCSDDIAPKMHEVNHVEPLVAEKISQERLSAIVFREDCFLTACQEGFIHTWKRPSGKVDEEGEEMRIDDDSEHKSSYSNPESNNNGDPASSNSGVSCYIFL